MRPTGQEPFTLTLGADGAVTTNALTDPRILHWLRPAQARPATDGGAAEPAGTCSALTTAPAGAPGRNCSMVSSWPTRAATAAGCSSSLGPPCRASRRLRSSRTGPVRCSWSLTPPAPYLRTCDAASRCSPASLRSSVPLGFPRSAGMLTVSQNPSRGKSRSENRCELSAAPGRTHHDRSSRRGITSISPPLTACRWRRTTLSTRRVLDPDRRGCPGRRRADHDRHRHVLLVPPR